MTTIKEHIIRILKGDTDPIEIATIIAIAILINETEL